ncbi:MAG: pseudouridine synthase [Ferruginibacter sp.]
MHRYFLLNKPRNMVSQFVSPDKVGLLGELDFDFPEGTHAIGRLDGDSEGLLILTTNKKVTRLLYNNPTPHQRSYLVMLQNVISDESLQQLKEGVNIKIEGGKNYLAKPDAVERITAPEKLYAFAMDHRSVYPHTWLLITLSEGKFRQVRKMVLAIRHRCLRLVRLSIGNILLEDLPPGTVKELKEEDFFKAAGIPL